MIGSFQWLEIDGYHKSSSFYKKYQYRYISSNDVYVIVFPLVINFNSLFIIQRNDIWMTEKATNAYAHSGTYYYGLKQGVKYNDDWKYPSNKICFTAAKNAYSTLFMFIGI